MLVACLSCATTANAAAASETPSESSRPALRVGTTGDYAPFSVRTGAAGASARHAGFDIEVAERFAADEQRAITFVPFVWPLLLESLAEERFEVGMSGITIRPERSVAGRFTVPVAENGAVVLVRPGDLSLPEDLDRALAALDVPGVRIAVNRGGHLEHVTRARFRRAEIRAIADNAAVLEALVLGEVDALVTDSLEAPTFRRGHPTWRLVGPFTRDRKAYLLPASAAQLAERLDAWLLAREQDGTLARLREAHFCAGQGAGQGAGQAGGQGAGRAAGEGAGGAGARARASADVRTAEPVYALLAAADERLALMPFVADAKRRQGLGLVDSAREEEVLAAARAAVERAARTRGAAPPPAAAVEAFYRAQIDAAVEVQAAALARGDDPGPRAAFDLESELRPALLRIGDRMARLLVAASAAPPPADLAERVRAALDHHELSEAVLAAIAASVGGLTRGVAEAHQLPVGRAPGPDAQPDSPEVRPGASPEVRPGAWPEVRPE